MPNWCNNVAIIKHKNKEAIDRVVNAYNADKLCFEFIPVPEELMNAEPVKFGEKNEKMEKKYGFSSSYDFCIGKWGTKWDIGYGEGTNCIPKRETDNKVVLTFDSAWSPPIGLYAYLLNEGYDVSAFYYESGMAYCGKYSLDGDECYNIPSDSETAEDVLPEDINEMFGISENMEMWENN